VNASLKLVSMVAVTRRRNEMFVRRKLHTYRRLCFKAHSIFDQQATCASMRQMHVLVKQGKHLFYSVALRHVCQIGNGFTGCAICADIDAYGSCRPRNENPDPFPLLSNVPDVPEMTPEYKELLEPHLHPYKRLCKLTHSTFEKQERCATLQTMRRLAVDAMDLFETTEEPQIHACQMENCGPSCISCMERAAYGNIRPRSDI